LKLNTNEIQNIIEIALEAGKAVLDIYHSDDFQIENKDDNSPLTKADKASHEIIKKGLTENFPEIPLLSEEGKEIPYEDRKNWKKFWLVDPLDGTKEFIKKNGEFTVNIALIENNKPVFGVIYAPAIKHNNIDESISQSVNQKPIENHRSIDGLNDWVIVYNGLLGVLYLGGINFGSYKITSDGVKRINVSDKSPDDELNVVQSRSHSGEEEESFYSNYRVKSRLSRGSSLKICMIAEGEADIYFRGGPTWEWDTAAGHAILLGAGGYFINKDKTELVYNKEIIKNFGFIASSFEI